MRRPPLFPSTLVAALLLAACSGGGVAVDVDDAGASSETQAGASVTAEADEDDAATADAEVDADPDALEVADDAGDAGEQPSAAAAEALWWTADTVDGGELVAADLAGDDVVLWLWAPWCSVCNREAPEVAEVLGELPDDVRVVGVAGRDDVGPMQDFVARHGLEDMTHVVDADGSLWASYGVSYQPAWVFVDGDGEVSVAAGALGREGVLDAVEQVFGS